MAQPKTLSDKQVGLLRWIAAGCPEGGVEGQYYRISVGALRNRGLVTTSGRGPTWSAEITDAGREYLGEVDGPRPPKARQPDGSVSEQLVAAVAAAGGSLTVELLPRGSPHYVDYEARARLATRRGKVPSGKRLRVHHLDHWRLQIELVDAAKFADEPLQEVPVPEAIHRYHPVTKQFRDDKRRHEVSQASLPRATRIVQALVSEAERRGHGVELAPEPVTRQGYGRRQRWKATEHGHLVITVRGFPTSMRIHEEGLPSFAYWMERNTHYDYAKKAYVKPSLADYEAKATGRLAIELVPPYRQKGVIRRWSDHKTGSLEDKLPEILQAIAFRSAEAETQQRQAEREAAERRRAWEATVERAKRRHAEQQREDALGEQLARWQQATQIRDYCDTVEATHAADPAALEWVRWARGHADRLDPLDVAPHAPEPRPPGSIRDLEPFLNGERPPPTHPVARETPWRY